jgi:uncharacterized membrane protein
VIPHTVRDMAWHPTKPTTPEGYQACAVSLIGFVLLIAAALALLAWRVRGGHAAAAWQLVQIVGWLVAIGAVASAIYCVAQRFMD